MGELTLQDDGSYSATLTTTSDTPLSVTDLNAITASVTSTDGIDTSTTIETAKLEIDGTSDSETLTGTAADEVIDAGQGADTVNAGAGDDSIIFDKLDTVDGGEGLDSLVVVGDINIDFSALDDNISNIEQVTLGDGAQNITSLSVNDVLEMTDTDNLLRIDGDTADDINLNTTGADAEWTLGDFKTDAETGATYQEVTGGEGDDTVTLEISTQIEISES